MPRKPRILEQLWIFLKHSRSYEDGKTIDSIANELYGVNDFHSKCKARIQIHYLRKRLSEELKERYGINVIHPLFSSKPISNAERRYFIHFNKDDIDRVDKFFKVFMEGVKETYDGVKTFKTMIPSIRRVELDVKSKRKVKAEV
jgi:hypothetical protein